jgi:hypothetical protein
VGWAINSGNPKENMNPYSINKQVVMHIENAETGGRLALL